MIISYSQLEQILEKVGYSKSKIHTFRTTFNQTLFECVGRRVEPLLTEEQRKTFQQLASKKEVNIGDLAAYFKTLGIETQTQHITEEIFGEMASHTVEKMLERATAKQQAIIAQTLLPSV